MKQDGTKHLTILTEPEVKSLYDKPFFDAPEWRADYFSLPPEATDILETLTISSAVYFILQWAYFRSSHRFYEINFPDARADVKYILKTFFYNMPINKLQTPSRKTFIKIKNHILSLFRYKQIDKKKREVLIKHARKLAAQHNKPNIIFKKLFHYIEHQRWVLPAYSVMQDIIGQAMNQEISRLTNKINRLMPKKIKLRIDALLATEENLYGITELKKDIKNFSNIEIRKEINKRDKLNDTYAFSKKLIPQLKISRGNISYYASLAEYYTPYKLKRMPRNLAHLYFVCYTYHRVQKLNDNLVLSFIYRVSKFYEEAVDYGRTQFLLSQKDFTYDREKIGIILSYFGERSFQQYKFNTVAKKAYKLIPKPLLIEVSNHFKGETKKETEFRWDYFEKNHRSMTLGIKPLFMALEFGCDEPDNSVIKAAGILKGLFKSKQPLSQCDTSMLPRLAAPRKLKSYFKEKTPKSAYKNAFLVYYRLMKYLTNNKAYFNDSLAFKNFDEDIKITANWDERSQKTLNDLALPKLSIPIKNRLAQFH